MELIYENLVPESIRTEFTDKVKDIAKKLIIEPDWLMMVMQSESGLNSYAQYGKPYRKKGDPTNNVASGLIQIMPANLPQWGLTVQQMADMDAVDQLDYVYKYFKQFSNKITSFYDLYLVTFFPVAVGKSDDWVFEYKNISRSSVAKSNSGIDADKSGDITIAEFKRWIDGKIKKAGVLMESSAPVKVIKFGARNILPISISLTLITIGIVLIYKFKSKAK